MILASRNNLFRFEFPKVFIPQEVKDRWLPYVRRMPAPTEDISAIVNYSIQSVTVPNFNYEPAKQVKPGNASRARGTVRQWRGALSPEMLIDRGFEVTFKLLDGFFNYWVMMETFFHHYAHETAKPFIMDVPLRILDAEGTVMYTVLFHDVLFTEVGKFDLSYSEAAPDHQTFSCLFKFNEITYQFEGG